MFRNTINTYGSIAKLFHWLIALLVIGMFIIGFVMGAIENNTLRAFSYTLHKSIGLTILFLMLLRLCWRLINPTPKLPQTTAQWQKKAARTSHILLYILLIAMPLSGWIMATAAGHPPHFWWMVKANFPYIPLNKTLARFFSEVHQILAFITATLIIIHFSGAMKHYLIDKDGVLQRMLPGKT